MTSLAKDEDILCSALVIDRESSIRKTLCDILQNEGYTTVDFPTSKEAYASSLESPPEVAFIECSTPGSEGCKACQNMRKSHHTSDTYVVVITNSATPPDLKKSLSCRPDDYLIKPFAQEVLEVRMEITVRHIHERRNRRRAEEAMIRSQQLASIGTLTAGVAHEYNNIDTAALGFIDLIAAESNLPEEASQMLHRVRHALLRSSDLTRHLLSFAGSSLSQRSLWDLNTVIHDTLPIIHKELEAEGVTIVTILPELPHTVIDSSHVGQVILNLLINAGHAMQHCREKRLTIETGVEESMCYVKVSDTGCGIPADTIGSIFLPFFTTKESHKKASSSETPIKGTGLGLSVSDTIIKQHDGRITVASNPGAGTTFTVYLPLVTEAQALLKPLTKKTTPPPSPKQLRVMILDDDEDVRDCLTRILQSASHTIVPVANGSLGLRLHAENPFDMILIDLQMPEMTGTEFLAKLKKQPAPLPRIVIISGAMTEDTRNYCEELGADMILNKPLSIDQILACV